MGLTRNAEYEKCLELLDENEVVEFLSELIKVDSVNPPGNEKNAAMLAKAKFDEYEIKSEILDVESDQPNRANLLAQMGEPFFTVDILMLYLQVMDGYMIPLVQRLKGILCMGGEPAT